MCIKTLEDNSGTESVNIVSNYLNLLFGRGEHSTVEVFFFPFSFSFFLRCHCLSQAKQQGAAVIHSSCRQK